MEGKGNGLISATILVYIKRAWGTQPGKIVSGIETDLRSPVFWDVQLCKWAY
jgi:hypothetical protein